MVRYGRWTSLGVVPALGGGIYTCVSCAYAIVRAFTTATQAGHAVIQEVRGWKRLDRATCDARATQNAPQRTTSTVKGGPVLLPRASGPALAFP